MCSFVFQGWIIHKGMAYCWGLCAVDNPCVPLGDCAPCSAFHATRTSEANNKVKS